MWFTKNLNIILKEVGSQLYGLNDDKIEENRQKYGKTHWRKKKMIVYLKLFSTIF